MYLWRFPALCVEAALLMRVGSWGLFMVEVMEKSTGQGFADGKVTGFSRFVCTVPVGACFCN